ncbi:type I-U CRISPR-associated helicase/endonuclease Cas3 [Bifidobacterium simiarum]|uniref:type I-G CRISPR-associated helicase/endonuclease Cas3g n=1 Tax=Bifidobacterium simiarum TaxID=2045441 RepID=UPI001BDD64A1|nr:type I-U CRISPR-associated helicase/endonuclease Cas3 [Bifidobacterium simiarum]MBT1165781.1 type I-U CRISPR-associated helicase/endonuclease Cas3 [Bifidobacterium simiarum]
MIDDGIAAMIAERFERFVAAVHGGRRPYRWQQRLVRTILDEGRWPDRLSAPTGSGKTMVIDVHVFLNALAGLAQADGLAQTDDEFADPELVDAVRGLELERLPRRLVMTVNRRSLVDDQYDKAVELRDFIRAAGGNESSGREPHILSLVQQGLNAREGAIIRNGDDDGSYDSFRVTRLRGGEPVDRSTREWRYRPTACQVICATPDMFGSRLLFRGYGTTPQARPIEAGLLAYDTVLVADEAHLSRQLVKTAKSVSRLERSGNAGNDTALRGVSPLQVMSTTATQTVDGDDLNVSVEESDFGTDTDLCARLTKPKPVEIVTTDRKNLARAMAEQCVDEYDDKAVVGCIVNSVEMAEDVMKAMQAIQKEWKKAGKAFRGKIRSFVGPMRQYDKKQLTDSALFKAMKGDEQAIESTDLHYVIATQTLEVGIDADFTALITELPSASALVQRAGRVNRRGRRDFGRIIVFREPNLNTVKKSVYAADELQYAAQWLSAFEGTDSGLSAWACAQHPPRPAELSRVALQRLESWDVENLSHTDEELAADMTLTSQAPADVDLWLRDDFLSEDDPNIGVVVRSLPENDADALGLLRVAKPVADEAFPVRNRGQITELEKRLESGRPFRLFIVRANDEDEDSVMLWDDQAGSLNDYLHSGDILVVDVSAPLFDRDLHMLKPKKNGGACETDVYNLCQDRGVIISIPPTEESDDNGKLRRIFSMIRSTDVSEEPEADSSASGPSSGDHASDADRKTDSNPRLLRNVITDPVDREILRTAMWSSMSGKDAADDRDDHDESGSDPSTEFVRNYENISTSRFVFPPVDVEGGQASWLFIQRAEEALQGDAQQEMRKPVSGQKDVPVYLDTADGHQRSVERRAERFLRTIGLPDEIRWDVMIAACHHDDGKKDPRFQKLLRFRLPKSEHDDGTNYLAKSLYRSPVYEARIRRDLNLRGWRHEQRSAAECWADHDAIGANDIELVTRLAGTSHGHGRSCFRDDAATLIPQYVLDHRDLDPTLDIDGIRHAAEELFDEGVWERIISRTNMRYGYWGIAYLEAVLRAADVTISAEGR